MCRRALATAAASGSRKLDSDRGKVERVRTLLTELEDAFATMDREIYSRWTDSAADDAPGRELAYHDHRALQRLRRLLTNVLRAEQLEQ